MPLPLGQTMINKFGGLIRYEWSVQGYCAVDMKYFARVLRLVLMPVAVVLRQDVLISGDLRESTYLDDFPVYRSKSKPGPSASLSCVFEHFRAMEVSDK